MHKVLFISHFPDLKMGGQQSMLALIKNLDRQRYLPQVVMPETNTDLYDELQKINCKVHIVPLCALKPKYLLRNIRNFFAIRHIIKTEDIDIIHPDHERDSIICGYAARPTKCKTVWHVRLTRPIKTDSLSVKLADGIIGISEACRERFPQDISNKYITIFNGVNCEVFCPIPDYKKLRNELNLPHNEFLVLFVGQYKRGKGIIDLVKAEKILQDKNLTDIKFILCGSIKETDTYAEMMEFIQKNNLIDNISVLPQQHNIQRFMQACDTLVLPSHEGTEGMGRVLFEAMACEKPVIGTDVRGVREAFTKQSGVLIPEKSPEAIAEAVEKLYFDKQFYLSAAIEARKRALTAFDIKIHAINVMNFYDRLLK